MAINAPQTETECLYSTVRNIWPTEKFYGFLPPHGRRLACGEEMTVWGSIQHWLTRFTPNERARRSLERSLHPSDGSDPKLVLVNSPSVHLYDATRDETKILTLDNGAFVAADPCWGSYSSLSIACTDD